MQDVVCNNGYYNNPSDTIYAEQILNSRLTANGCDNGFIKEYGTLSNLSNITEIIDDESNTVLFMRTAAAHENMLLQLPDYIPLKYVDNSLFELAQKK